MAAGIGSFGFGTGPQLEVPFAVAGAVSLSEILVKVEFTAALDWTHVANFNPINYTIAGLSVLDVSWAGGSVVHLRTTAQSDASYVVHVNSTPGRIRALGADFLDPASAEATFDGQPVKATFTATAQSKRKVLLQFSEPVAFGVGFSNAANYHLVQADGLVVTIASAEQTGPDDTRVQLLLAVDLTPSAHYSLRLGAALRTAAGKVLLPDRAQFQWRKTSRSPVQLGFARFSGEVTGGLLGNPAGQVFLSPAFGANSANSVLEVESVAVCTRSWDAYEIPRVPWRPGPTLLMSPKSLVLWGPAHEFGQAATNLHDRQSEAFAPPWEGPAEGWLYEPIDITRAAFLNDDRWRTFPAFDAALGVFRTADNGTPIGPGPETGPLAIG